MDTHRHALTRDGVAIDLSPRYVQILAHLLSHPGQVISKTALLDTVWADVFVTDNNLEQAISEIRKAVDDDAATQRVIQTVKRKGYRFGTTFANIRTFVLIILSAELKNPRFARRANRRFTSRFQDRQRFH